MPKKRKKRRPTGERFYLPQDVTSPIARLYRRYVKGQRPVPLFPPIVQVETQSGCNAACAFCPNKKTMATLPQGRMDEALFRKIIDEAVAYGPERISPYLNNEPLLDPDLPDRIRYIASKKRPSTEISINTNASRLEGGLARELLRCGLNALHISFHGISKESYEASMRGLNFEENLRRVDDFLALWREAPEPKPHVHVTMVHSKLIEAEIPRIRAYWGERGIKAVIRPLGNRAHVAVEQANLNPGEWLPFVHCKELIHQAVIIYNGDVLLCCVDWERSTVLGNLRDQSLYEVWNGPKFLDIRRRYFSGNVQGILCGRCKRAKGTG